MTALIRHLSHPFHPEAPVQLQPSRGTAIHRKLVYSHQSIKTNRTSRQPRSKARSVIRDSGAMADAVAVTGHSSPPTGFGHAQCSHCP